MIGPVAPGSTQTAVLLDAPTGLTGTLTVTVYTITGAVVLAETASGISEVGPGTYKRTFTAPAGTNVQFFAEWDDGTNTTTEEWLTSGGVAPSGTFYEIDEAVFEGVPITSRTGAAVNVLVGKDDATVHVFDSDTTTPRPVYDQPDGTELTQPLSTVNGRIEGFVQGETAVDLVVNQGQPNEYTQRWLPPQRGSQGPVGPDGEVTQSSYTAVTGLTPVVATGDRTTDIANVQAAIDAATAGGTVQLAGDFAVDGIVVGTKPIRLQGMGMSMGATNPNGTRLRRTAGAAPIVSAVGTGLGAGQRARVEIVDMAFDGGGFAGIVLDIERAQAIYLHRLDIGNAGDTGLRLREVYNASADNLHIHDCGNGSADPAMLMDAVAGAGQGGSASIGFVNMRWESNYGTDLKVTGDGTTANPTVDQRFCNFKFEGGRASSVNCPYIDLDNCHNVGFVNGSIIVHGDSGATDRTVALVVQGAGSAGTSIPNQLANMVVELNNSGGGAVPYVVDVTRNAMQVANLSVIEASAGVGTALVNIGAAVNAGFVTWNGIVTNSPKPWVSDGRAAVSVVAAATLTLPEHTDYITVTGNTNISAIADSRRGRLVSLAFTGTPTLIDGGGLVLAGNQSMTADDLILLRALGPGQGWAQAAPVAAN